MKDLGVTEIPNDNFIDENLIRNTITKVKNQPKLVKLKENDNSI